jgi:hypothetical protein
MQTFHQNLFVYSVFLKNLIDFDETFDEREKERKREREKERKREREKERKREREKERDTHTHTRTHTHTQTDNIALIALKFAQQQVSKQTEILSKKIFFSIKLPGSRLFLSSFERLRGK